MPVDNALFVLIHSPLVGPLTWALVAAEMERRGLPALVPVLEDASQRDAPYWRQQVDSVARALGDVASGRRLALVGHSGAGALLPAIGQAAGHAVAAHLFVDAGIHRDGVSRLDLMRAESPEWAEALRRQLAAGGRFPDWTDEALREVLPDTELRRRLLSELRPQGLAFFTEPIPLPAGWPDAPCAYLQFSAAYDTPAAQARRAGWPYRRLDGGHFHMLVEPGAVTDALIALAGACGATR